MERRSFEEMKNFQKAVLLLSIFLFISCPKKENRVPETASKVKKEKMEVIDLETTKRLVGKGAVLIDNRPLSKFEKGHLEGAINLPFFAEDHPTNEMTRENLEKAIAGKKTVVFYCTGRMRAHNALKQAKEWGIKAEMYWYKNGFQEWSRTENVVR